MLRSETIRVLLLQIRDADDDMQLHEQGCIVRRVGERDVQWLHQNVLIDEVSRHVARECDAMIIGGSGDYSVHHPESEGFVTRLRHVIDGSVAANVPLFGLCFGHQLLGVHFGSAVVTEPAHAELGTASLHLTEAAADDPVFGALPAAFSASTGHSDHVCETPPGAELLATNAACATQAFRFPDTRMYSTQFHPDLLAAEATVRWRRYREHLIHDGVTDEGDSPFTEGKDDAAMLLGRFIDAVRDGQI